jgi:NAD(P)-dependent dehydrogenase (short-subunit alcohol dehydrogenase family)
MKWTTENMGNLNGKVVIVTGANSGLGYYTTLAFARKGAEVIMAVRNTEKGKSAAKNIKASMNRADLKLMQLDLADLDSVKSFAENFKKEYKQLDILVNNAGLMAIPESRTKQGFEMQFGTNHLGHFALTIHLADILTKTENSRIVTVSSLMHKIGKINFSDLNWNGSYKKWAAYGQSKLANLLFTYELQRKLEEAGKSAIAVTAHPGYAATNLQTKGAIMEGSNFNKMLNEMANKIFAQSAEMGALPTLYAAVEPSLKGGEFIGPDRMGGSRGYPTIAKVNGNKLNPEVAKRLWEVSEELTGLKLELEE